MKSLCGSHLRAQLGSEALLPFVGVYDVFSASLAAQYYQGLFLSGFGFSASFYGLPDMGFIAWSDLVAFVQRVRAVLPDHHLLVDIDDGYGDTEVACHVVSLMESAGASGVILEDQKRPRQCGHLDGKQLMDLNEFLIKLQRVLGTRKDLFVVARTDAHDPQEQIARALAFAQAGADAILLEAIPDLKTIQQLKHQIKQPLMVNQIAGGKSPLWSLGELRAAGVAMVNYSTPCLFAAQGAIHEALLALKTNDGLLSSQMKAEGTVQGCTAILRNNLARRDKK
jgi:2-methylisocitrate lyase-like PEP mutase family enzyme